LQAVSVMAMLFQDTSEAQIHLEYLARRRVEGSRFFDPNVSRLARVIELMARLQEEQPALYNELAYPPGTGSSFNNNIYHYYVPWFLAATLRAQGSQPRAAGIAPLMLSATYEFITSGEDYSYMFFDPKQLTSAWTIKDIFAGTSGAHRGSKTGKPAPALLSVMPLFHQNSKSAMMELLKAF